MNPPVDPTLELLLEWSAQSRSVARAAAEVLGQASPSVRPPPSPRRLLLPPPSSPPARRVTGTDAPLRLYIPASQSECPIQRVEPDEQLDRESDDVPLWSVSRQSDDVRPGYREVGVLSGG